MVTGYFLLLLQKHCLRILNSAGTYTQVYEHTATYPMESWCAGTVCSRVWPLSTVKTYHCTLTMCTGLKNELHELLQWLHVQQQIGLVCHAIAHSAICWHNSQCCGSQTACTNIAMLWLGVNWVGLQCRLLQWLLTYVATYDWILYLCSCTHAVTMRQTLPCTIL